MDWSIFLKPETWIEAVKAALPVIIATFVLGVGAALLAVIRGQWNKYQRRRDASEWPMRLKKAMDTEKEISRK